MKLLELDRDVLRIMPVNYQFSKIVDLESIELFRQHRIRDYIEVSITNSKKVGVFSHHNPISKILSYNNKNNGT